MASNEDPSSVETETIDVTPIISNTSSSTECKYCKEPENKQDKPGMICENCVSLVHLSCLRRPGTPGDFACDVFFDFTCEDCSPNNKEIFLRNRFPWVNVIHLTLHHLNMQSYGISNHGYFHYKTHICSFIDRYWHSLFGTQTKQKKNWVGTIAGVLSVYNKLFFKSGSVVLGETGWWKLLHNFSPAVAAHIIQEIAKDKPKMKPRNQMTIDKNLFIAKVAEMGYKDLVCESADPPMTSPVEVVPFKKRRVDWEADTANTSQEQSETEVNQEGTSDGFEEPAILVPVKSAETDYKVLEFASSSYVPPIQSDTSSVNSQQPYLFYDSDSRSSLQDNKPQEEEPTTKKTEEENPIRSISLFSDKPNSISMPWIRKLPKPSEDLVEMSPYEEVQLLKKLEGIVGRVKDPIRRAELYRLKAKLSLRRLKRHKHLPVFDFDKTVKLLGGYVSDDRRVVLNAERVLDRFQRSYLMDNLSGTISNSNCGTLLLCHIEPTPFRSPYSGAMLKPFIRIDQEVKPLWLQMTDELLKKTNRNIPDYAPPPHATLDFSYVRPQHIAAVNSLCAQFFWPGIDLTEALQYPEFSCVVTYKRLVVGCAFLVPDAGRNEAYISFVIARPHWRRAGLATFMLYHLLQTCTGKDVTLHVSPTNPAIFLYQKFGFKVEELIQDFYEKYYDIDYKGCRHALFLRLAR